MDNLTHTLVGAALTEAGLKKRTALASATLMIGANFPDVDVIALFFPGSLDVRRGITHGFPALAILPFVLAWLMLLYDRHVRRRRDPSAEPADYRQLTLLAAVAIWTHPTLDFMNTYGMRWLMPMVNKWFYADALFIVDPWILLVLGVGVWMTRRRVSVQPARVALGAVAAYIVVMLGITSLAREQAGGGGMGSRLMMAPVPLVPWERQMVKDEGAHYQLGRWSLFGGLTPGAQLPKGDTGPDREAVMRAREDPGIQPFLRWSRFPVYWVRRAGGVTIVNIEDARYRGADWASAGVALP